MPLHLLSKKSWNVYSPANRARVARDEALAAAAQRDSDREHRDAESASNLDRLRDEVKRSDRKPVELSEQEKLLLAATKNLGESRQDSKKRKRLSGEDDTDRDIRYAKERSDKRYGDDDSQLVKVRSSTRIGENVSITDRRGNINLFPEPKVESSKPRPQTDLEKEIERQKSTEEGSGMHFKDVWGRKGTEEAWYVGRERQSKESRGRDVWGNEDPKRGERDAKRIVSSDPLAVMQKAQLQLKEVKREKQEKERDQRTISKSRFDDSDLEDFSLDGSTVGRQRKHERPPRSHSPHRKREHRSRHDHREDDNHHHSRYRDSRRHDSRHSRRKGEYRSNES